MCRTSQDLHKGFQHFCVLLWFFTGRCTHTYILHHFLALQQSHYCSSHSAVILDGHSKTNHMFCPIRNAMWIKHSSVKLYAYFIGCSVSSSVFVPLRCISTEFTHWYPISKCVQVTCQGWEHNRAIVPAMAARCVTHYSLKYFYLTGLLQEIMAANILICSVRRLNIPIWPTNSRLCNVLFEIKRLVLHVT